MYQRNENAAWWVEDPADAPPDTKPRRIRRWADRPMRSRRGDCLAIRIEGDAIHVLVQRDREREWLPLARVMSEAEAERWMRIGFTRQTR